MIRDKKLRLIQKRQIFTHISWAELLSFSCLPLMSSIKEMCSVRCKKKESAKKIDPGVKLIKNDYLAFLIPMTVLLFKYAIHY